VDGYAAYTQLAKAKIGSNEGMVRAPVHGDQGFRLEGTTVSGG
jgi:hypothetical protein